MKKVPAYLFSALLMSGVALAQEDAQAPEDSQEQTQKTEEKGTLASEERVKEKDAKQKNAESKKTSSEKKSDDTSASSEKFMTKQSENQIRSDQLVGSDILNASDEKIGSISNLIIDQDGQVAGIIVGVGGFLGMGEKHVALSWDAVEITPAEGQANYQVITSISKEDIDNATAYKTEEKQEGERQLEQQQSQVPKKKQVQE